MCLTENYVYASGYPTGLSLLCLYLQVLHKHTHHLHISGYGNGDLGKADYLYSPL